MYRGSSQTSISNFQFDIPGRANQHWPRPISYSFLNNYQHDSQLRVPSQFGVYRPKHPISIIPSIGYVFIDTLIYSSPPPTFLVILLFPPNWKEAFSWKLGPTRSFFYCSPPPPSPALETATTHPFVNVMGPGLRFNLSPGKCLNVGQSSVQERVPKLWRSGRGSHTKGVKPVSQTGSVPFCQPKGSDILWASPAWDLNILSSNLGHRNSWSFSLSAKRLLVLVSSMEGLAWLKYNNTNF